MKSEDFIKGMAVAFLPIHVKGDITHKDAEFGVVSSINNKFVFVKFNNQIHEFGWDNATSETCSASMLHIIINYKTQGGF